MLEYHRRTTPRTFITLSLLNSRIFEDSLLLIYGLVATGDQNRQQTTWETTVKSFDGFNGNWDVWNASVIASHEPSKLLSKHKVLVETSWLRRAIHSLHCC